MLQRRFASVVLFVKSCDNALAEALKRASTRLPAQHSLTLLPRGFDIQQADAPSVPHCQCSASVSRFHSPPLPLLIRDESEAVTSSAPVRDRDLRDAVRWLRRRGQWSLSTAELCANYIRYCKAQSLRPDGFVLREVCAALLRSRRYNAALRLSLAGGHLPQRADDVISLIDHVDIVTGQEMEDLAALVNNSAVHRHDMKILAALLNRATRVPAAWRVCLAVYRTVQQLHEWETAGELYDKGSALIDDRPNNLPPKYPIRNLYHVCYPIACAHQAADEAECILCDSMLREPEILGELLLRGLLSEGDVGRQLALRFCAHAGVSAGGEETTRHHLPLLQSLAAAEKTHLGLRLFEAHPTPRNVCSLIRLFDSPTLKSDLRDVSARERSRAAAELLAHSVASVRNQTSTEDAMEIAAAVAEQGCWMTAVAVASTAWSGCSRFAAALSLLSESPFRSGQWSETLALVTESIARRPSDDITPREFEICVHSATAAGKYDTALFWLSRAQSKGVALPQSVSDAATNNAKGQHRRRPQKPVNWGQLWRFETRSRINTPQ